VELEVHSNKLNRGQQVQICLSQLCPTQDPVYVSAAVKLSYVVTSPYFDNLDFDTFDAGGPQCQFITSVTIAVGVRTL